MNSPGIRPRNNKPAAGGHHVPMVDGVINKGSQQGLRVLAEDGTPRATPSIAMPRANTELTKLLAGDDLLCVRRPPSASVPRAYADANSELPGMRAQPKAESPRTPIADADLASVIDSWPTLPRNVRSAILAMIRGTTASDA